MHKLHQPVATHLPPIQTFSVNVPRAGIGTNLRLETVAKKRRVFLGTFPRGARRASFVRKRASLALIPLVPLPSLLDSGVLRLRAGRTHGRTRKRRTPMTREMKVKLQPTRPNSPFTPFWFLSLVLCGQYSADS